MMVYDCSARYSLGVGGFMVVDFGLWWFMMVCGCSARHSLGVGGFMMVYCCCGRNRDCSKQCFRAKTQRRKDLIFSKLRMLKIRLAQNAE